MKNGSIIYKEEIDSTSGYFGGDASGASYQMHQQHMNNGNIRGMNRICRDFVRGLCRRKYCRVSSAHIML